MIIKITKKLFLIFGPFVVNSNGKIQTEISKKKVYNLTEQLTWNRDAS